jgi:hypothetical protein
VKVVMWGDNQSILKKSELLQQQADMMNNGPGLRR